MSTIKSNVASGTVATTAPQGKVIAQNTAQAVKVIAVGAKELSPLAQAIAEATAKVEALKAEQRQNLAKIKAEQNRLLAEQKRLKAQAQAEAKALKAQQAEAKRLQAEAQGGNTKGALCGAIIATLVLSAKPVTPKVVGTLLAEAHAKVLAQKEPNIEHTPNVREGIFAARYCIAALKAYTQAIAEAEAQVK